MGETLHDAANLAPEQHAAACEPTHTDLQDAQQLQDFISPFTYGNIRGTVMRSTLQVLMKKRVASLDGLLKNGYEGCLGPRAGRCGPCFRRLFPYNC